MGAPTNYGPDTIAKGDAIKTRGSWYRVVRVNKKSVSVDVSDMYQAPTRVYTHTIPYPEIRDHKPAASAAAETVQDLDATG
ncbi:hypothetical protein [Gordonia alkaliphila]|uniref:Uncharacterized protein n=1 Tax=Gordonia alkaliphila TaxID=1053547 RepID=A0ABP8ZLW3_9ACTN